MNHLVLATYRWLWSMLKMPSDINEELICVSVGVLPLSEGEIQFSGPKK